MKLKKTVLTAVAALGVAGMVGGGTFAGWTSTTSFDDNSAGAGILELSVVDGGNGGDVAFTNVSLAPGEGKDRNLHLASSDGASVPDAKLTMTFLNDVHTEDGCRGDEKDDDTDCDQDNGGEFAQNADLLIRAYKTTNGYCGSNPNGGEYTTTVHNDKLQAAFDAGAMDVGSIVVEPGDDICVNSHLTLDSSADNSMQGDSVDFDVQFQLEQL